MGFHSIYGGSSVRHALDPVHTHAGFDLRRNEWKASDTNSKNEIQLIRFCGVIFSACCQHRIDATTKINCVSFYSLFWRLVMVFVFNSTICDFAHSDRWRWCEFNRIFYLSIWIIMCTKYQTIHHNLSACDTKHVNVAGSRMVTLSL